MRNARSLPAIFGALVSAALLAIPGRAVVPAGTLGPNDLLVTTPAGIAVFSAADGTPKPAAGNPDGNLMVAHPGLDGKALFGPDGHLRVIEQVAYDTNRVLRRDGSTGARLTDGSTGAPLDDPSPHVGFGYWKYTGAVFHPDGYLYVSVDSGAERTTLYRLDPFTGAILGEVPRTGWQEGLALALGGDGRLYYCVSDNQDGTYYGQQIWRWDPVTDALEGVVSGLPALSENFLPVREMVFGPDGALYLTYRLGRGYELSPPEYVPPLAETPELTCVSRLDVTTGAFQERYLELPGRSGGLAFGPEDDDLYVSVEGDASGIYRYYGPTKKENAGRLRDVFIPGVTGSGIAFNRGATVSGTNVEVKPLQMASVTFGNVTSPGQTTITPLSSDLTPLPEQFKIHASGGFTTFFDITCTAGLSPDPLDGAVADLALEYQEGQVVNGSAPHLWHYEPGYTHPVTGLPWRDITEAWVARYGSPKTMPDGSVVVNGVDTVKRRVYGRTPGFSPFALARIPHVVSWSGILQPIDTGRISVFRRGSTVPVKFRLTNEDAGKTDYVARLSVAQLNGTDPGPVTEAISNAASSTGNLFRYDAADDQYVFNWSTKGLPVGTYRLWVDFRDGTTRTVDIGLK